MRQGAEPTGSGHVVVEQTLEARGVEDADMFLLDGHQTFFLEAREGAGDGFQLQPQVGADFVTGHPQVKLGRRKAPRGEALRHVEQKSRQALFGAHRAEQHHHAVVAHDLAAHDLVELMLQAFDLAGEFFEAAEGNHADLAVFEGDGVA